MITHSLMKVKESAFSFTELAKATPFFHSVRFVLAILGCLMFIHLYAQRVGMSVAIVCMVNQTAVGELSRQTSGGDSNSSTDDVMQRTPSNPQCTRTVTGKNETAPLLVSRLCRPRKIHPKTSHMNFDEQLNKCLVNKVAHRTLNSNYTSSNQNTEDSN